MQVLIDREQDLIFSWSPGCMFRDNKYIKGAIGRRGPGITDEDLKKPYVCSGPPSSLMFSIRCNNNNVLYKEILDVLSNLKDKDQLEINIQLPRTTKRQIRLKEGFQSKADEINEKNNEAREKVSLLIEQLKQLGCNCDDLICPDYNIIPAEWYEWEEDTYASVNVCCHNKTEFYKFLQEKGILDKYFPEWYRKGDF